MDIFDAINTRRSIRDFSERPVGGEILKKLIEAALRAPSNDHMRRWYFISVSDTMERKTLIDASGEFGSEAKKKINEIIKRMKLTDKLQTEMYKDAIPKQKKMLLEAPVLLVPIYYSRNKISSMKNEFEMNYVVSIWMAIENLLLAAASFGIFGVTCVPRNTGELKKILEIPQNYEIACLLPLGYPVEDVYKPVQHVAKVEDHLMHGKFRISQDTEK
jgi:nitroreductase